MLDIEKCNADILANKVKNSFPTDDAVHEFDLLKKEVIEAEEVIDDPEKLPAELADIAIFVMSLARMKGIDLEKEILQKIEYNKNRSYKAGTYRTNEKATH